MSARTIRDWRSKFVDNKLIDSSANSGRLRTFEQAEVEALAGLVFQKNSEKQQVTYADVMDVAKTAFGKSVTVTTMARVLREIGVVPRRRKRMSTTTFTSMTCHQYILILSKICPERFAMGHNCSRVLILRTRRIGATN